MKAVEAAPPAGVAAPAEATVAVSAGATVAVSAGAGVLAAVLPGFTGRVVGVFGSGFYVAAGDDIFAVLGPATWPGPLHLQVASLPVLPAVGDRVMATETALVTNDLRIETARCRPFVPCLPAGGGRAPLGSDPELWAGLVPAVEPDLAPVWGEVVAGVRTGDLNGVCHRLQGLGSGLTPSGDDVLAGIMLVRAIDRCRRPALRRLARKARTTGLSRAFLWWAASGQSIQPAHAVLEAASSGDRRALGRVSPILAAVGASSGRALLAGMALAALEPPRHEPAATLVCCR